MPQVRQAKSFFGPVGNRGHECIQVACGRLLLVRLKHRLHEEAELVRRQEVVM